MLLLDRCPSRSSSRLYTWTAFFLIYINDPLDNLTSNTKLLADETSLFSTVTNPNVTANQINNDLPNINTWAHQWKINFKA